MIIIGDVFYGLMPTQSVAFRSECGGEEWKVFEEELTVKLNKTDALTPEDASFDDYAPAVKTAERLMEWEREKVAEFNKEHGTNFDLPVFEIDHDKK